MNCSNPSTWGEGESFEEVKEYLKEYNRSTATEEDKRVADSVGQAILLSSNTESSRRILAKYVTEINASQVYIDSLFSWNISAGDNLGIGETYFVQGKKNHRSFDFDKAFYNYLKAEYVLEREKDSVLLSDIYTHKAIVVSNQGFNARALDEIYKAIDLNKFGKNVKELAFENFVLGSIHVGLGQFDEAKIAFNLSLSYLNNNDYQQFGNTIEKTIDTVLVHIYLSKILNAEKRYTETIAFVQSSIRQHLTKNTAYEEMLIALLKEQELVAKLALKELDGLEKEFEYIQSVFKTQNILSKYSEVNILFSQYCFVTGRSKQADALLKEVFSYLEDNPTLDMEREALKVHLSSAVFQDNEKYERYLKVVDKSLAVKKELNLDHYDVSAKIEKMHEENSMLASQRTRLIGTSLGGALLLVTLFFMAFIYFKRNEVKMVKRFQKETELYYESLLSVHKKLNEVQLNERKIIARDLHDGVLNSLFVVRFGLSELHENGDDKLKEDLISEVAQVERYIRDSSHSLLDSSVGEVGFKQLLENLVLLQNRSKRTMFSATISEELNEKDICPEKKINIYQILQEALQNIQKHAFAVKCEVHCFQNDQDQMILSIEDNGVGFDVEKVTRGIGLLSIEERAAKLKAEYFFDSSNKGTKLRFVIPWSSEE